MIHWEVAWEVVSTHPVLTSIVCVLCVMWLVSYLSCGVCKCASSMEGKTVIVTGCTSGIGVETALELARRGARVIMACCDDEKAEEVKDMIVQETKNTEVVVRLLDLSLMQSVRQFAEEIIHSESRLDVLIHNAEVFLSTKTNTEEGLNLVWATNQFGPFLLTHLLIELMKKTKNSRIVTVSSAAHFLGGVDPLKPNVSDEMFDFTLYSKTKFANVLFTNELARRLQGSGVTANSLHPGIVFTPLCCRCPVPVILLAFLSRPFFKTARQGAQTTVHLAVSEDVDGVTGKYFCDCKTWPPARKTRDLELAKSYWKVCEELVQLQSSDPRI